jgi:signal peptidase II
MSPSPQSSSLQPSAFPWRAELKKKKYLMLLVVCVAVIFIDQWTKYAVHKNFHWGESRAIVQNFFALTYVRNTGAAFGFLNRAPAAFREPFFIIVPLVAMAVILMIFIRLREEQNLMAMALSLVLSGAIGNLIDRLRFGFVIDFLDFHWKEVYHWPAFNVADSCIVVGVGILFILSWGKPPESKLA